MAERRSIGNLVAPPQFFLFLALLFLCAWVATQFLADRALGILAGFDFAAAAFLVACVPLLRTREASAIQRHANASNKNDKASRVSLLLARFFVSNQLNKKR